MSAHETNDIERLLKHEETQLSRQTEVERIMSLSMLDPFAILSLPLTCTPQDIKLAYRSKSRLIHPDKTTHEKAREAFERLKKAETDLMDDEKRKSILTMVDEAKRELSMEWTKEVESGKRNEFDAKSPEFEQAAMEKYRAIMIDIEWRRRQRVKQELAAEGAAANKRDEEVKERKRKRDEEKVWEDKREERVSSWRDFQKKSKKSKKSKAAKSSAALGSK
ncbi:DnaJ domain-containing protein [Linderina macrospora]|uniref:DnaJ domain-containing protein n=1 Tax=Linderina macrospora TaxID=4868 RepID=A0ACC1J7P1_9FUNG|nr:DnaJ domain-containing protein [Linderina macrospora]